MNRKFLIVPAVIMLLILGTCFYYTGRRLFRWLQLVARGGHVRIFTGICVFFVLAIVLSFLPFDTGVKKVPVRLAWFLTGLFLYTLMFFFLSDIVLFVAGIVKAVPRPAPRNIIIAAGCIVLACAAGTALYGACNAANIKQAFYTVRIDDRKTPLKKLNIVLVADLHLGYVNDGKRLEKIADKINALEPDIVCIAGDIFDNNFNALPDPERAEAALRSIKSVYGVYACPGNHDGGKTFDAMLRFLERGNVRTLLDEYLVVEDGFIIAGRKDSRPIGGQGRARKDLNYAADVTDKNLPVIVLDHNPANIKEYGGETDLILSGHTHRGQMFPANIITRLMYDVHYGYYRKNDGGPRVVVTSGAGSWGPPLRVGTDSEIACILAEFD